MKIWLAENKSENAVNITKSGIDKGLKALAKQSNLVTTGNVRFHRIRGWTFNSLLRAGFSELEAKYVCGKQISHSDSMYLRLKEIIEEKYPRLYDQFLNIKPQVNGGVKVLAEKVSEIEQTIADLRKTINEKDRQLSELKTLIDEKSEALRKEFFEERMRVKEK